MANNDAFPPLDDLAVFLAVARGEGFRRAARWLGVSPSTVSETVSRLEARLGTPLLIRTTRSVRLTEPGRALAARLEPAMAEARAALDEAASAQGEVRGRLKLTVPGAVMVDILPPILDGFLAAHPQVTVEVLVEDGFVDLAARGCDAGIRYGEHLAQDVIAVPIGPRRQRYAVAASPDYLARRGAPRRPEDLLAHDCIQVRFASGALARWEFEKDGETLYVDPAPRVVLGAAGSAAGIELALAGRGVVGMFGNWLDPHFARGALVPLLEDWCPEFDGPRLYFSRRLMPRPRRAFVDQVAALRAAEGRPTGPPR